MGQSINPFVKCNNKYVRKAIGIIVYIVSVFTTIYTYAGEAPQSDGSGFSAQVLSQYRYDDNILSDSTNIIDAYIFVIRPELGWQFGEGNKQFQIRFSNETAKYEGSSEDNYSDNFLNFSGDIELNSKHNINLTAALVDAHQNRGTGFNTSNGNAQREVDTLNQNDFGLRYSYGSDSTVGQLDLYYGQSTVDFDERLDSFGNDVTLLRDRTDTNFGAEFSYAMSAKTDLVVDLSRTELDYDLETGLGNTVNALLVGVSWQASAKTLGRALIGRQDRDASVGGSSNDGIWQLGFDWSPRSYSTVSLNSSKSSQASIGVGNARDVSSTNIDWNHEWTSQLNTNVGFTTQQTDFIGTNTSTKSTSLNIGLSYIMDSNILLSVDYTNTERDSDITNSQFGFERELISFNLLIAY